LVGWVQEHLEAIYGIRCAQRAHEYLLNEEAARLLGGTCRSSEELLVHQEGDELWLGLYFGTELLARFAELTPEVLRAALEKNLATYCEVAEGISHFLYVAHTANQGRTVSLLELETQAEIDKFASCLLHSWHDRSPSRARELHRRLFDCVRFDPQLTGDEARRYEEANRLSRTYCSRLIPHVLAGRLDRLLSDLRYSYRLGAEAKLRHLANAA
jgi:hypothetical protein